MLLAKKFLLNFISLKDWWSQKRAETRQRWKNARRLPLSRQILPPQIVSPLLQKCYARATCIFQLLLVKTVLLHRSLGLWIIYQRVLGFRPSYRTAVELLYIAIHIVRNLYVWIYRWGTRFRGGHNLMWQRDYTCHS